MSWLALIALDCRTGLVSRYQRQSGSRPRKTGEIRFRSWDGFGQGDGERVWHHLQRFRLGYVLPEEPRPPLPLRFIPERFP